MNWYYVFSKPYLSIVLLLIKIIDYPLKTLIEGQCNTIYISLLYFQRSYNLSQVQFAQLPFGFIINHCCHLHNKLLREYNRLRKILWQV